MNWINEDWEYPTDEIYAIERYKLMEAEWQQWESKHVRKPALIKVLKPTKDEIKRYASTVRRAYQKRL